MTHEAAGPQSETQRQGAPIIYLVDDDPSFLRALSRRRIPNSVYLRKPVVAAVLLEAVRSLLSRSKRVPVQRWFRVWLSGALLRHR
jgi:DNA-binding response OmpR family regulator